MLLLLGGVGGIEEYRVIEAVKNGITRKLPIVAWWRTAVDSRMPRPVAALRHRTLDGRDAELKLYR